MKEQIKKYWSTMDALTRAAFCFLGGIVAVIIAGAICGNLIAQVIVVILFTVIIAIVFCTAIFLVKEWFGKNF